MKKLVFFLLFILPFIVFSQKRLNNEQFNALRKNKDVQVVDVRTDKEIAEGKIPNSIHIDYFRKDFIEECKRKLDKSKPVLLYCAAGGRSYTAMENLKKAGFKKIYDLKNGFDAWKE